MQRYEIIPQNIAYLNIVTSHGGDRNEAFVWQDTTPAFYGHYVDFMRPITTIGDTSSEIAKSLFVNTSWK